MEKEHREMRSSNRGLRVKFLELAGKINETTPEHSNFKHQPLDLSNQQIRLLRMDASKAISCSTQHVDLGNNPMYKALSYTWGDPFPTRKISINEQPLIIRENLYRFLETIKSDQETLWWIDQICIDQSNIHERNHQVNFMDQIYCNALEVVVWLGPAADDSDKAMRLIGGNQRKGSPYLDSNTPIDLPSIPELFLRSIGPPLSIPGPTASNPGPPLPPLIPSPKHIYRGELKPSGDPKAALRALFQRPYWHRTWIIQEIMLARSLVVFCGAMRIEWSTLESFLLVPKTLRTSVYMASLHHLEDISAGTVRTIVTEKASREQYIERLSNVLATFSNWQCGDVRDRVYGLLGLLPESSRVAIDYSKPVKEIFFDVLRKVIEDEYYMALTTHLDFARTMLRTLELKHVSFDDVERFVIDEFERVRVSRFG